MEEIFHEKQEGYLCGQHCLNSLLQGSYFNAVDLGCLARQLDDEEEARMAEAGIDSEDYKRFREQPSGNVDDSGYFSVQVISSALKVWGLELIPYNSREPIAIIAQNDPTQMQAYICNYKGHWFTIRKIGNQWFNLNSILSGPQLLSNTYLSMYFAQLLQEGYSIFIVIGQLPECKADEILLKNPVRVTQKSGKASNDEGKVFGSGGHRLGTMEEDEAKIREAVAGLEAVRVPSSSSAVGSTAKPSDKPRERIIPIKIEGVEKEENDDEDLQRALQLSLQDVDETTDKPLKLRLDLDTNKSERFFETIEESDDDDELRKALQLSLECVTAPPTPDPEDVRWKRLRYLGIHPPNSEPSTKLNT
ncbi:ataxin-3 [Fopius arisanus]|uniref:ubiquitinyl hydrolase 1 n=1 Tax=Fopius arisanus TaxID=64838 RepID=A0A0C9RAU4_9HYME|nr:PREDICTED: ataxin-3-like [Fopius arisanus]